MTSCIFSRALYTGSNTCWRSFGSAADTYHTTLSVGLASKPSWHDWQKEGTSKCGLQHLGWAGHAAPSPTTRLSEARKQQGGHHRQHTPARVSSHCSPTQFLSFSVCQRFLMDTAMNMGPHWRSHPRHDSYRALEKHHGMQSCHSDDILSGSKFVAFFFFYSLAGLGNQDQRICQVPPDQGYVVSSNEMLFLL